MKGHEAYDHHASAATQLHLGRRAGPMAVAKVWWRRMRMGFVQDVLQTAVFDPASLDREMPRGIIGHRTLDAEQTGVEIGEDQEGGVAGVVRTSINRLIHAWRPDGPPHRCKHRPNPVRPDHGPRHPKQRT